MLVKIKDAIKMCNKTPENQASCPMWRGRGSISPHFRCLQSLTSSSINTKEKEAPIHFGCSFVPLG